MVSANSACPQRTFKWACLLAVRFCMDPDTFLAIWRGLTLAVEVE
jgi:hypothetical protein